GRGIRADPGGRGAAQLPLGTEGERPASRRDRVLQQALKGQVTLLVSGLPGSRNSELASPRRVTQAFHEGRGWVRQDLLQGDRAMPLHVNPHELILIGENSFLRLSTDGGQHASTRCSHWRVLWTPSGAGHALFVDSGGSCGVRIYADSVPLVR